MALYSVVFLGSTPIGAPFIGWLAQAWGPRAGLVVGALAALIAAVVARGAFMRAGHTVDAPRVADRHAARVRVARVASQFAGRR
jgi:hypothetical protein